MSKGFVVMVLAIAGCGVGVEGDGAGSGEPVEKVTSHIVYGSHDYYFFQPQLYWDSARIKCFDVGHLVTIGDSLENDFVRSQIAQHGGGTWWIGRNDERRETFWVWEGSEPLRYDNWAAGQPANITGLEDCAAMDGVTGKWSALNCNNQLNYVCERDSNLLPPTQSFNYGAGNTNFDTQSYAVWLVDLFGNQAVTVGTCGLPGAVANGDTYLRLFKPDGVTELAHNDDACNGVGSNLTYVVPANGTYVIHAGCWSDVSCSGTVAIRQEGMAPPAPSPPGP
jgi:Lectin C-type domain